MKLQTLQAAIVIGIVSILCSANASAAGGIKVGLLTCNVVPGSRVNLIIRSTADVECVFENNGVSEEYHGETGIALGPSLDRLLEISRQCHPDPPHYLRCL